MGGPVRASNVSFLLPATCHAGTCSEILHEHLGIQRTGACKRSTEPCRTVNWRCVTGGDRQTEQTCAGCLELTVVVREKEVERDPQAPGVRGHGRIRVCVCECVCAVSTAKCRKLRPPLGLRPLSFAHFPARCCTVDLSGRYLASISGIVRSGTCYEEPVAHHSNRRCARIHLAHSWTDGVIDFCTYLTVTVRG